MPKFIRKKNSINISVDFIERYIFETNPTYIIVYIYALRLAADNLCVDYDYIAKKLRLLQSDVVKAFEYWEENGMVIFDGDNIIFVESDENISVKTENISTFNKNIKNNEENIGYNNAKTYDENKNYDNLEVSNDIQLNQLLSDMLEKTQELMGRPLNTNEIHTLYSIYEQLNLPPQVIVLLVEFCVSKKKSNMNYIEKVAVSWSEKDITTLEKALKFLEDEKSKKDLLNELKKIFQIYDRNFTEMEEEVIINWITNYNMDVELIKYAYEITIMNTNKFSVQYMDKILERWHRENIFTLEDAKTSGERFKQNQGKYDTYSNAPYDYKDLENREWKK